MTDKEKAKAYDEALERARKKYDSKYHPSEGPSGVYLNNADLEEIFPALKESEDERIRRCIGVALTDVDEQRFKGFGTTLKDCLAYLEKQKINTEGDFARGYDCGYECCLNSHGAEYLEKQKEQKPTELERLEKVREMTKEIREAYERGIEVGKCIEQKPTDDKSFEDWIDGWYNEHHRDGYITMDEREFKNWSRGIRNMYQQKSTEWSEEEQQIIEDAAGTLINFSNTVETEEEEEELCELASKLQDLKPQPKQEWDEEEFEIFRKTLAKDAFLDEVTSKRVAKKLLNSVKSLCHSWKPSEEQMKALYQVAYNLICTGTETDVYLVQLYEQLKKL